MRNRLGRSDRTPRRRPPALADLDLGGRWRFDPNLPLLDSAPSTDRIWHWIESMVAEGIRRPGYPADAWAEAWLAAQLRALGVGDVTSEPVELTRWTPGTATLEVRPARGETITIEGFPLPHSRPTGGLTATLVPPGHRHVTGSIAMSRVDLTTIEGSALRAAASDAFDPEGFFDGSTQTLPLGTDLHDVMRPFDDAGAVAFVGALGAEGWETRDLHLPYDGVSRSMPGIWITPSDADRLERLLASEPAEATLRVEAVREPVRTANVVGVIPGASDQWVVIGSHHDAPWASAVHASGPALVLAQAALWSRLPIEERPHNLCFLFTTGSMAGSVGTQAFVRDHEAMLDKIVLAVHLEHAGVAAEVRDGRLVPRPEPETRWWFASQNGALHDLLGSAIRAEHLTRSLMFNPDVFAAAPPTDGGALHEAGVPIVDLMPAPRYLLDRSDGLEMVHRPSLVPVTRAVARLVADLKGMTAAVFRWDAPN